MTIMTIDPGESGSGYALWNLKRFKKKKITSPYTYGVIRKRNTDLMILKFKSLMIKHNAKKVYCEDAAYMPGSSKGIMVGRTGALVTLAEFIGRIKQLCYELGIVFELVPVRKWKGTLPKDVVIRRIKRKIPRLQAKSHDWDAVGIGLYLMGGM